MTEAEFDRRVRGMEGRMYRTARAMLKNEFDCADAMQNAVFAAWRRLPSLRDEARFEAWLMRILINAIRDAQRQQARRKETPLADTHPTPETGRDLDIQNALEALPEKQRLCVALHHLSGYSVPEIARMLTLPQTTVKGRIREGLKKMKQMLEEEEP